MSTYCFISCTGKAKVPDEDKWKNSINGGINRLYYIVDGIGGYYKNQKKHYFKKNHLYLLPAYNDFPTWSSYKSENDRLNHIFVNFEMIPPIITNEVIEFNPHNDPMVSIALSMLDKISDSAKLRMYNIGEDELYYLKATVIYIVSKMAKAGEIKMLKDKILISALHEMHDNISTDISIQEIAIKSHMSYYGFIRRFKNALGITPYTYLKQLRIRTANVLRDEGATLEEAAEKCGYSDPSTLLHAISREKKLPKAK